MNWASVAAIGWGFSAVILCAAAYVVFEQQRMLKRAWAREDFYREKAMEMLELMRKPVISGSPEPIIFPDGSIK